MSDLPACKWCNGALVASPSAEPPVIECIRCGMKHPLDPHPWDRVIPWSKILRKAETKDRLRLVLQLGYTPRRIGWEYERLEREEQSWMRFTVSLNPPSGEPFVAYESMKAELIQRHSDLVIRCEADVWESIGEYLEKQNAR